MDPYGNTYDVAATTLSRDASTKPPVPIGLPFSDALVATKFSEPSGLPHLVIAWTVELLWFREAYRILHVLALVLPQAI